MNIFLDKFTCKNCVFYKIQDCTIKIWNTEDGMQRYICKNCSKTFILKSNCQYYDEEFNRKNKNYILKVILQE